MPDVNPNSPLLVRIPPDLKKWLHGHAEINGRNMTKEIVQLIKAERDRSKKSETHPG